MPNQPLSERIQRIIAHLQEVWQHPQPISPADLTRITEFVLNLPEQYQAANLQTLSLSDTAEEAQNWLYELPAMYYQQLSQEKLIMNTSTSTQN